MGLFGSWFGGGNQSEVPPHKESEPLPPMNADPKGNLACEKALKEVIKMHLEANPNGKLDLRIVQIDVGVEADHCTVKQQHVDNARNPSASTTVASR